MSKKERKKLISQLREEYGLVISSEKIEVAEVDKVQYYLIDGSPAFILLDNELVPLLKWMLRNGHCFLPKIVVDKGAVKPVSSGADLMAPGIVSIEGDFQKGDIIVVIDETHGAPLAVMKALYSSSEIKEMKKGKVALNLHHIGDKHWKTVF